jgi:acyl-CoA thioester hydrolase
LSDLATRSTVDGTPNIGPVNDLPDLPWDHPAPFVLPVQPVADDIDGLDHTNNAVYVRWCEQAGWAHSEALNLSLADYRRLDRAMAIRQAHYDYTLPTVVGDELLLGTWLLAGDGRLTMTRVFQLLRRRDRATVMRGRWELVCIEVSSGRPRRLPPEFEQGYGAAMVVKASDAAVAAKA